MKTTDDYLVLITGEHQDKPRFADVIEALTKGPADITNLNLSIPSFYDLDTALGVQLDAIGEWVGVTRILQTPITGVYFEWSGTALVGWGSGSWKGKFDPATGLTVLPDDAYRLLLRAKIAANSWDGTIPSAVAIWTALFGTGQQIIIQDNQDMSMVIGFVGDPLTAIQQALLIGGYLPLKPAGVRVSFYAIPIDTGPLFAWRTDTTLLKGWGEGSWAQSR